MNEDQAAELLMNLEEPPPALSEADKASITRAFADSEAGRVRPHAEVMRKYGITG